MTSTASKIVPVALVAALLGGTAGAFISRNNSGADSRVASASQIEQPSPAETATVSPDDSANPNYEAANANDPNSYKEGYNDGFSDASKAGTARQTTAATQSSRRQVAYRSSRRATGYRSTSRAYYDYSQPRSRSFWDKHRDKLTVAMGAGGGALLGGLFGGKKGAAIGALAGGGGSALYTYKIRKRSPRY
jgi:hypothetical protein